MCCVYCDYVLSILSLCVACIVVMCCVCWGYVLRVLWLFVSCIVVMCCVCCGYVLRVLWLCVACVVCIVVMCCVRFSWHQQVHPLNNIKYLLFITVNNVDSSLLGRDVVSLGVWSPTLRINSSSFVHRPCSLEDEGENVLETSLKHLLTAKHHWNTYSRRNITETLTHGETSLKHLLTEAALNPRTQESSITRLRELRNSRNVCVLREVGN